MNGFLVVMIVYPQMKLLLFKNYVDNETQLDQTTELFEAITIKASIVANMGEMCAFMLKP